MQYSIWYHYQTVSDGLLGERTQEEAVELFRNINVIALRSCFVQVFSCQVLNLLPSPERDLEASAFLGFPNAILARLPEDEFNNTCVHRMNISTFFYLL